MKEIIATQGYYLTQVAEVGDNRIFVTRLKGANIDENAWREATLAEKEAFEQEQLKRMENGNEEN